MRCRQARSKLVAHKARRWTADPEDQLRGSCLKTTSVYVANPRVPGPHHHWHQAIEVSFL